jgi:hypothetical protein
MEIESKEYGVKPVMGLPLTIGDTAIHRAEMFALDFAQSAD